MERLPSKALYHKYLAIALTYSTTHRLILGFILHEHTLINQGVLAEEVASRFGCLFKQWGVLRNADRYLAVNRGAISRF